LIATPAPGAALPKACTPRTDWPEYTVQPGETLSSIARRTDSTVEALVTANCLANPDVIQVGQKLRVPKQPVAVTATPTGTPAPAATPPPGRTPAPTPATTPTPAPATKPSTQLTLTYVIGASNTAQQDGAPNRYRALADTVQIGISAPGARRIEIRRNDGVTVASADAAGGTLGVNRVHATAGNEIIILIAAIGPDDTTVQSDFIRIRWG